MNDDNLNMAIRKFLKKVGISSQRFIENNIHEAHKNGTIKDGDEIKLEMTLIIRNIDLKNIIQDKILID